MENDSLTVERSELLVRSVKTKKEIEALSEIKVFEEMEEGFIDPIKELVMATKLAAFFTARVSALRGHALDALKGEKELTALGSKVSKAVEPSRWEYKDNYLDELKEEIKLVQEKAQLGNDKDRHHITLSGESIVIQKGFKKLGGETAKVLL